MMDPRIKLIKKYVQNHIIEERISLKRAAEITNLSSNYFSSLFKKEVSMTFSRYLKLERMKKAKELLRKGAFTNKEISYHLGFRHVSSFYREFKEVTGTIHSEYRRRFRIFRLCQHVRGEIVRIVHSIGRIANAVVRFINKIRINVNRK